MSPAAAVSLRDGRDRCPLVEALEEARASYPDVRADAAAFAAHVDGCRERGARVEHGADLFVAWAAARGDAAARRHFERLLAPEVDAAARRFDRAPVFADELRQAVRVRLLVAEAGRIRLDDYVGRGPLRGWLAVVALRVADGAAAALIVRDRLVIVDIAHPGPTREVPGTFADEAVCGWSTGGEVLVRTRSPPIHVRRVDPATGASSAVVDIAPPRLGMRGVDAVVIDPAGDAYAYSYGQELSRLYTMTTEES